MRFDKHLGQFGESLSFALRCVAFQTIDVLRKLLVPIFNAEDCNAQGDGKYDNGGGRRLILRYIPNHRSSTYGAE